MYPDISILAPARGATRQGKVLNDKIIISILAPARGATVKRYAGIFFQSHFNPRSREGSDNNYIPSPFTKRLFQSSLPRGERRMTGSCPGMSIEFQSSLPRGERRSSTSSSLSILQIFQSSLPRGERLVVQKTVPPKFSFQSSLPRGERPPFFVLLFDP